MNVVAVSWRAKKSASIGTGNIAGVATAVVAGNFREDLYYRINVVPLRIPPLRERPGDVLILAHHFLEKFNTFTGKAVARISAEALDLLSRNRWKGNVRELENTLERAVLLSDHPVLSDADLGAVIAYVKSVPGVDRTWPTRRFGPIATMLIALGKLPIVNGIWADGSMEAARIARMAADGGASATVTVSATISPSTTPSRSDARRPRRARRALARSRPERRDTMTQRLLLFGAIIVVVVWQGTPFYMMNFLAGLQSIPDELYEAAEIDGATAWQRFVRITLPLLKPALLVALYLLAMTLFSRQPAPAMRGTSG